LKAVVFSKRYPKRCQINVEWTKKPHNTLRDTRTMIFIPKRDDDHPRPSIIGKCPPPPPEL